MAKRFIAKATPAAVYAVYAPPHPSLPWLSVTVTADGKVKARSFLNQNDATEHAQKAAKSDVADNTQH